MQNVVQNKGAIIPYTEQQGQPSFEQTQPRWQEEMQQLIDRPETLCEVLQLGNNELEHMRAACRDFALQVPRPYLKRIQAGKRNDPLLLQVLPQGRELETHPGYSHDPLGEEQANPLPGLIHKYRGRVLLTVSGKCAINCRYCFRRHFAYSDNRPSRQQWQAVLDYIAADPSINEVIFSGGDPLSAPDRHLAWLAEELSQLPNIQRLRIHTRLPIMIPSRINEEFCQWLSTLPLQKVVVLHINHAQEIDKAVREAIAKIQACKTTVLNQAVLLKDINDNVDTLTQLSESLFASSVLPYYLHLLDPVVGAAHFNVDEESALKLLDKLRTQLPGFLVPKLVKELAGQASKTPCGVT